MRISIRAPKLSLSPRLRSAIEMHVRRMIERNHSRTASVVLYITPTRLFGSKREFVCRMVVWSPVFGHVAVNAEAMSVNKSVRRAVRRGRRALRQRLRILQDLKRRRHQPNGFLIASR